MGEQIIIIATVLGTVAALPALIEFLIEQYKKQERISLSLEELMVAGLEVRLAGFDEMLADITDLIDRAKSPEAYRALKVGNEILVIGPPLSGKKTLAKKIAQQAMIDRIIIVHNVRNVDALTKAKQKIQRARNEKIMLLLPRLDMIDDAADEQLVTELDALIETSSERENVLVIGTSTQLQPGGEIDNLFGITLALPGTVIENMTRVPVQENVTRMLGAVANFYLKATLQGGYTLNDITHEGFIARLLMAASNPSQIEDIVTLCQTTALYRQRRDKTSQIMITPEILEIAIRRVIIDDALAQKVA